MPKVSSQLGLIQNGFWSLSAGGAPPYTPPLMPISARPWMAHLYNNDWSFRASLGAIIGQRPVIKQTLNSGFQPVTVELPTLNTTVQPGNLIVITEEGGDATGAAPAGTPVIGGIIEQVPDTLQVSGWKHQITITPFVAELGDTYLTKNYTTPTDVAQMVRDAISASPNHLRANWQTIPSSTGITAIYNFNNAPALEVLDHCRLIAGVNWSWFVDAVGFVWFQPINVGTPGQSPSLSVDSGSVQLTSANAPGGFCSIALASFKAAGSATPALVGALGAFTTGNTTIVSPTFGQATKAGDLLVAWLGCGSIDPVTTAAGWAKVVGTDGNSSKRSVIWAKANCAAGETAPSFTAGGGIETLFAQLGEFSGVASLAYVDNTAVASPFANPMSITAPNPDVATSDLVLLASGWVLSGSATATFQESMSGGRSAVHAGDSGGTSVGRHSSFAYGLAAPTTPAVSVPAMFTVKPTDYTSFQTNGGDISGLKNYCLVVGGVPPGGTAPITATYSNPTSQTTYNLRAVNPPLSVPGVTNQSTLNAIATTVGGIYDRVINRVTIELPAYANRILLGQPGGSTMRYFSPSKYPLTESATGTGTYSATYVVLDVETDGIQQRVTIGDVPPAIPADVSYMTARSAALATVETIVQPKVPAVDHYDLDDGDASHPIYIDYVVPSSAATIGRATLSWHMRAFRSTTNLSPSSVGSDATGSSGHSHSHGHTIPIAQSGAAAANINWNGSGTSLTTINNATGGNTSAINSDGTGESGHSHSHSHTLTGSASQAVTDGASTTITALSIDGTDYTSKLGGPWSGDLVELDITTIFPTATGSWHTITLSLAGLGRVVSMLRLYYV